MKKSLYIAIILLISIVSLFSSTSTFAATCYDAFGSEMICGAVDTTLNVPAQTPTSSSTTTSSNILNQGNGITDADLRAGNVDMNTIPQVIVSVIQTLLAIAGTVAIFSLIYHAVQMQINSGITGDSSGVDKAKKWMQWALIGFIIAIAAWFLVTRAVELLGAVS